MWHSTATRLPNYYATRLLTPRAMLRPLKLQDYKAWHAVRLRNKDALQPFEPRWSEDALEERFFKEKIVLQKQNWLRDAGYAFVIVANDDQTILGGINLNHVARGAAQQATLGYWIDGAEQGRGYMHEALEAVIAFARDDLRLHRLHAGTLPHNMRSRALLERSSFIEEGLARQYVSIDGAWQDHVLYGLVL
ncbi:MAG: GNAT family protein [Pseudomonadota bacterium]